MGGIVGKAGIFGFLENLRNFYERADIESENWRVFVAAWWEKFQDQEIGVSQLCDLLEDVDPPTSLGRGSERSQKSKLGHELKRARDRRFSIEIPPGDHAEVRLEPGKAYRRASQWRLVRSERGGDV